MSIECELSARWRVLIRSIAVATMEKPSSSGWSSEATRALIGIWGQADVQSKLDSVKRNKDIFQQIAKELADLGYSWTWQQCRTKIKNLTQAYRKV